MKNTLQNTLIFVHIPKAAGSTLNYILNRQYKTYQTIQIDGVRVQETIDEFKNLPLEKRSTIKLIKGHGTFGLHEFIPHPSIYFTVLRNPVDRIISHYYYVQRRPDHYLHDIVTSKNIELNDYVSSGISPELDNGQVRLLSDHFDFVNQGQATKKLLDTAKKNLLQYFSVVGISEMFDETLMLLKRELAWKGYPLYRRVNVTGKRPMLDDIPRNTIDKIKKYNEFDCELYEWAKKRFLKELASRQMSIKTELILFRASNIIAQQFLNIKRYIRNQKDL